MNSVPNQRERWDSLHERARPPDAEPAHRDFTDDFLASLPSPAAAGPLLEVGCGQGHDAVYMAGRGYSLYALDFSLTAIAQAELHGREHPGVKISFVHHDTKVPFPWDAVTFGGIYAYLSLHYFDDPTTRRIFGELRRVLRPGGVLAFCVKSTSDPLFGKGTRLAPDMYSLDGHVRHFFSREYATDLLSSWEMVRMTHCFASYLDSTVQSGLLQVIARSRPENTPA